MWWLIKSYLSLMMHQVKKWTKIMANPMLISITNATRIELGLCGRVRTVLQRKGLLKVSNISTNQQD